MYNKVIWYPSRPRHQGCHGTLWVGQCVARRRHHTVVRSLLNPCCATCLSSPLQRVEEGDQWIAPGGGSAMRYVGHWKSLAELAMRSCHVALTKPPMHGAMALHCPVGRSCAGILAQVSDFRKHRHEPCDGAPAQAGAQGGSSAGRPPRRSPAGKSMPQQTRTYRTAAVQRDAICAQAHAHTAVNIWLDGAVWLVAHHGDVTRARVVESPAWLFAAGLRAKTRTHLSAVVLPPSTTWKQTFGGPVAD